MLGCWGGVCVEEGGGGGRKGGGKGEGENNSVMVPGQTSQFQWANLS